MSAGASPLSILLASSEVVGFAKTGGLADVCGYLPRALAERGHQVAVIMPLYRCVRNGPFAPQPLEVWLPIPLGSQIIPARLWRSKLPGCEVPIFFIEHRDFFERDDPTHGRSLYQATQADGTKKDYPDNAARFILFSRAVLEAIPHLGFPIDILHANDWQTGLTPVYLNELYRHRPGYRKIRSLFTVHNIAYQGVFPYRDVYHMTGLDHRLFNQHQLEFYGQLNFLKSGVVFSDWVNTVSPTYAQEIRTTYFGYGLEGVLTEKRGKLSGIVNGVDYKSWSPDTDSLIPAHYNMETVARGKAICKAELQRRFGLPEDSRVVMLGMIARLVEQKGIDLVTRAAEDLLKQPMQIVLLGEGDPQYHDKLRRLQEKYPRQIGLYIGFDEPMAHLIEAGSDLYLMPSLFEPSGLNQLYSLRYGTPPIVRATGGLADTITDTNEETLAAGTATGFRFQAYTPAALLATIQRAIDLHQNYPDQFERVILNGMKQDWSWARSAVAYEELYQRLATERESKPVAIRA